MVMLEKPMVAGLAAALSSLAGRLSSTISSSAFEKACERIQFFREGSRDPRGLGAMIRDVHSSLRYAVAFHALRYSATEGWLYKLRDVLYEADDLFDEVAILNLLKQKADGNKLGKQVWLSCSPFNPIVSAFATAKKVEAIRERLVQISEDASRLGFVGGRNGISIFVCGRNEVSAFAGFRVSETCSDVNRETVFGREEDKKAVLDFLSRQLSADQDISVFSIVGIGGYGKTTLAQLVFNDDGVKKMFDWRWWVSLCGMVEEKDVIGKISQSLTSNDYRNMSVNQMESATKQHIRGKRFLLILDDWEDEDRDRGLRLRALLSGGEEGSKVIVTTRSLLAASAMRSNHTYALDGLSEEASWRLLKANAFEPEENVCQVRRRIGNAIVKKCGYVPLLIISTAGLLSQRKNISDWEHVMKAENPLMEIWSNMPDRSCFGFEQLAPELKCCFAYCSLFPKDYVFVKDDLVQLWISQGYVYHNSSDESQTLEDVGHMYFMSLLRRCYFQVVVKSSDGEILSCKMNGFMHDLAGLVARGEIALLTTDKNQFSGPIRHLAIDYRTDDSRKSLPALIDAKQLYSLFMFKGPLDSLVFSQRITKLKSLRVLSLQAMVLWEVPNSIEELIHLRYLNLSYNYIKFLPQSITKLLNLLTLDISRCEQLEELPNDFRNLINLRHLRNKGCRRLRHMPPGFEELSSLQHLSYFKVGKACGSTKSSRLNVLAGLKLKRDLEIKFDDDIDNWDEDELASDISHISAKVEDLHILHYPGKSIPSLPPNLMNLHLRFFKRVTHLPPLRRLNYLENLILCSMDELEYIEADEEKNEGRKGTTVAAAEDSSSPFFPWLEKLELSYLPKLKRCSKKAGTASQDKAADQDKPSFPLLSILKIEGCPELESMPLCPLLQTLELQMTKVKVIEQLLSLSVKHLTIRDCYGLVSFPGEALTSLRRLEITNCKKLRNVQLPPAHLNIVEELTIESCLVLELWENDSRGVDWDSLTCLHLLRLDEIPNAQGLPSCLQHRKDEHRLKIMDWGASSDW